MTFAIYCVLVLLAFFAGVFTHKYVLDEAVTVKEAVRMEFEKLRNELKAKL